MFFTGSQTYLRVGTLSIIAGVIEELVLLLC